MLAAADLMTACGDDGDNPSPTAVGSDWPRTVGRGFAETEVPTRPVRVAATADRDQLDVRLALGLTPCCTGSAATTR